MIMKLKKGVNIMLMYFHNDCFFFVTVTTTNQAITALKMLRENRNRFDLIISDVYMPDMDGFKLLELIGLEMDLPVISKPQCTSCTSILTFEVN